MSRKILLAVLLVGFVAYAAYSFVDSVTPYVTVREARQATSNVQVKGVLDRSAPAPHQEGDYFVFGLADEDTGEPLAVKYKGTKPDQFDEAVHIVAIGKCEDGTFIANKLLIKCPSKYEGKKPTK